MLQVQREVQLELPTSKLWGRFAQHCFSQQLLLLLLMVVVLLLMMLLVMLLLLLLDQMLLLLRFAAVPALRLHSKKHSYIRNCRNSLQPAAAAAHPAWWRGACSTALAKLHCAPCVGGPG